MPRAGLEISLDALHFARLVHPGAYFVWGQAMSEPLSLTAALMRQRAQIGRMRAFVGIGWSDSATPMHADHVDFLSYCGAGNNRRLGDRLAIVPTHYSGLASMLERESPVLLLQ